MQVHFVSWCVCCLVCAGLREWESLHAEEVVQPKRLLQQIHSQEELVHGHLGTQVKNHTEGVQVSPTCCAHLGYMQIVQATKANIILLNCFSQIPCSIT